jgi:hypothetical protein
VKCAVNRLADLPVPAQTLLILMSLLLRVPHRLQPQEQQLLGLKAAANKQVNERPLNRWRLAMCAAMHLGRFHPVGVTSKVEVMTSRELVRPPSGLMGCNAKSISDPADRDRRRLSVKISILKECSPRQTPCTTTVVHLSSSSRSAGHHLTGNYRSGMSRLFLNCMYRSTD